MKPRPSALSGGDENRGSTFFYNTNERLFALTPGYNGLHLHGIQNCYLRTTSIAWFHLNQTSRLKCPYSALATGVSDAYFPEPCGAYHEGITFFQAGLIPQPDPHLKRRGRETPGTTEPRYWHGTLDKPIPRPVTVVRYTRRGIHFFEDGVIDPHHLGLLIGIIVHIDKYKETNIRRDTPLRLQGVGESI